MRISDWSADVCSSDLRNHDLALEAQRRGYSKDSAFLFQQATESLYQGVLLTLTYYSPYNHNIAFLRSLAEGVDRRLFGIWPEEIGRASCRERVCQYV